MTAMTAGDGSSGKTCRTTTTTTNAVAVLCAIIKCKVFQSTVMACLCSSCSCCCHKFDCYSYFFLGGGHENGNMANTLVGSRVVGVQLSCCLLQPALGHKFENMFDGHRGSQSSSHVWLG